MQNSSSLTDDLLIKRIKSDDFDAFNELYYRYSDKLVNYVFSKVQDLSEAEDIVQEIFFSLWVNKNSLLEFTSISNYLYKIALNKSLNIFKQEKIKEAYLNSLAIHLNEQSYDMHEEAEEDIREQQLLEVLKSLPEKMRKVFELRYFYGYSNQQVADALEISIHTVSTQMKRALKTIREQMGVVIFLYLIDKL